MRDSREINEPLLVVLQDGVTLDAATADGGGTFIGETPTGDEPFYEVHFTTPDGDFLVVPQRDIRAVYVKATGEEVEFGNPYMPDHPRPKELPDEED